MVTPVRVLFITPYLPNALRPRPLHLLKSLAPRHRITLLAPVFGQQAAAEAEVEELRTSLPQLEIETVYCNKGRSLAESLLALPQGRPMQGHYCYNRELVAKARHLVRRNAFDLVHVEHLRMGYMGEALADSGLPAVYDGVDCISLLLARALKDGPAFQRLISRIELDRVKRYEGYLLSGGGFKAVCATSQEDARALEALAGLGRGAVQVISNGVDYDFFRPDPSRARHPATLIFTGKMSYHANAVAGRYLVSQLWPKVRRAHPQARLWIVGSGPPADLRRLSGRNGITVWGQVPELPFFLSQATLAVAPLVYSVGIQNKVLEAMACGTPTVASQEVSRSIAARDGSEIILASTRQPDQMAGKIIELLDSPRLAARIGEAGRAYVRQHHSWPEAAARLEKLWSGQAQTDAARPKLNNITSGIKELVK